MYRPNFCAECGHKLLRLRWHFWTSRKFCNDCARRLRKARLLPLLIGSFSLLVAGYVIGRARRPLPPPLIIERSANSPLTDNQPPPTGSAPASTFSSGSASPGTQTALSTIEEPVYMCGARTKKGTPCSRRVHGPVRCWQHKGMPAMLPQAKLLIKDLAP
jgi:hypothetical protein